MPKIVVKRKAEIQQEYPIRPFQNRIKIGSEGDNDLVISDKKVSMHHLIIEKDGTKYFVSDTDSAFGTFINGQKIEGKTLLMSGDEISLGDHSLLFENVLFEHSPEVTANPVTEQTEPKSAHHITTATPEDIDKPPQSAQELTPVPTKNPEEQITERIQYYLLSIYGPYIGKKYHLNYGVTKIGRDKTLNDIIIRENSKGEVDTSISRRHATIVFENDTFHIYDKRSKTRTFVNKEKVDEDRSIPLKPGDEIEIVSDQKSSIFRLVREGDWNYSQPQKAGDWWIRNSNLVIQITSAVAIIALLINLFMSWKSFSVIKQKPNPLKASEQTWLTEEKSMGSYMSVDDITRQMSSMTPLIGDLNGDRINDLIYADIIGYIHVIDGSTRKSMWNKNFEYRIQFPIHPVLVDLNNNEMPDLILPNYDGRIYAIDGNTGTEIWNSPLINGEISGAPVVADINGDKLNDIIFCTRHGEINIGYATYSEPRWEIHQTNSEILSTPAAGDFNGDGVCEIALGSENGEVFLFNGLANKFSNIININEELQKAKGSFFEDHQIRVHISIGKIDNDNCDDFIVTTEQSNLIVFSGKTLKRLWFDELIPEMPLADRSIIPPALGDLNGDKYLDVAMFTTDDKIVAYSGLGQSGNEKKIMWGFMSEINETFVAHPVIADINKDGNSDVIAAGLFGGIYILDGQNGKLLWQQQDSEDNLQNAIISSPLIADMSGDKLMEIIYRRANQKICFLKTNAKFPQTTILWSQINNDARQAGALNFPGLNASNYLLSIIISILIICSLVLINTYLLKKRQKYFSI